MNEVEESVFRETGHAETGEKRLSLERIEEAARRIDPVFLGSPQYEAEALGDELGRHSVHRVPENTAPAGIGAGITELRFIAACFAAAAG